MIVAFCVKYKFPLSIGHHISKNIFDIRAEKKHISRDIFFTHLSTSCLFYIF